MPQIDIIFIMIYAGEIFFFVSVISLFFREYIASKYNSFFGLSNVFFLIIHTMYCYNRRHRGGMRWLRGR